MNLNSQLIEEAENCTDKIEILSVDVDGRKTYITEWGTLEEYERKMANKFLHEITFRSRGSSRGFGDSKKARNKRRRERKKEKKKEEREKVNEVNESDGVDLDLIERFLNPRLYKHYYI